MMKNGYIFLLSIFLFSCGKGLLVVQKPIPFGENRQELSLRYLKERHGLTQTSPTIKPKMVVVHWTAIETLEASFNAFKSDTLKGRAELNKRGTLNVSSQYLIDRDGIVYQLMPDTVLARHVIGLNYCAIGIENVGSDKNPLNKAQFKANTKLIKQLAKKYPIEWLIGHHEYQKFKNSALWKETDPTYLTTKTDPGDEFMNRLRAKLKKLKFKATP